ncbi:NAD(P)H oxidoreductase [Fulvivirga sp. RKSG066]|uniref:glutathione-regulated potassium-efflux system oxidoreductase KefF n=1 Tax=Fulvivirga aurantia TaxID=2529383 RepID=UPI0012BCDC83|nr:NAD(P)H-dependent oxidoreductase [Fulvivirga aurantia]MTI21720.1 NAD(P)H oxidoreductase [Fulvivirga aurantia]
MQKILILFAHPKYEQSRTNKSLVEKVRDLEGVTFRDLYEIYPDFNINVLYEKELLNAHDIIIWHHPFYWYSCPPLLKQWIDVVLEFGWAYGPSGNALTGKKVMNVLTAGGSKEVYCSEGYNNYSIREFLRPMEQTARLCGMTYLPPFAVMGTHKLSDEELQVHANSYSQLIQMLKEDFPKENISQYHFVNDVPPLKANS